MLETRYPGQVSSSTVPSLGSKNVKLAGQRHPETGIVFDQRGFPIFDSVVVFETKIPRTLALVDHSQKHMKAATAMLKEEILAGKLAAKNLLLNS